MGKVRERDNERVNGNKVMQETESRRLREKGKRESK